jgi:hypothetical protein
MEAILLQENGFRLSSYPVIGTLSGDPDTIATYGA